MDEFEKRMHFTSFVTTLSDVVTKMNPMSLVGSDAQKLIESAGLKDNLASATKKWLDMVIAFSDKVCVLGSKYPIEELLGIKTDPKV